MRLLIQICAVVVLGLAGCSSDQQQQSDSNIRPTKIEATTGPYVSVAVDNHFHDVHPEDDITFDSSRPFVVRNEGSNLHNVSISEVDFSKDIRTGESVRLELEPGIYHLVCKYHPESNMNGRFTVE